jgi:FkbM family methyltransferase
MSNEWEDRAQRAVDRKNKLLSFGPNAWGLLVTTKHGLFAVDPEDAFVGAALLNEGCYGESEYMLAKSLLSTTSDMLIVGAHIGAHAVPLSRDCNELVAIEANPHTFRYLKTNFLLNRCHNVVSYNIAAGEKAETIKFLMNRENSGGSKRMPSSAHIHYVYDKPEVIEIESISLDELLYPRRFDLILMDIEGSEYFALKGMQKILGEAKALSVEFLPHHIKDVANVEINDFIDTIIPHFEYMYIPRSKEILNKDEINKRIEDMYRIGEGHDGIYFLKELSLDWLKKREIELVTQ